jgi:DNA-nicking Smr family endonuclease
MRLDDLAQLRDALRARHRVRARAQARLRRMQEEQNHQEHHSAEIFREAVRDVVPLPPSDRALHKVSKPAPRPLQRERDESLALKSSLSDEIDIEALLNTDETLSWKRPAIDPQVLPRLRRGHWSVQAHVDLHGLRVEEAREALGVFLADARRREIRCVRIVHGKGLGSLNREPVLKRMVLRWLVQRGDVLAFCQARPNDGGAGALIVLLAGPAKVPPPD